MISISDKDILVLKKQIQALGPHIRRHERAALRIAAKPLIDEIQVRAPQSTKPHYRYGTPKIVKGARAPKGSGVIVAEYIPGNLEASFQILPLRRSTGVIIGPKVSKSGGSVFGPGGISDGYYAHMVEFGTEHSAAKPFVRPALYAVQGTVLQIAVEQLKRAVFRYENGLGPQRK